MANNIRVAALLAIAALLSGCGTMRPTQPPGAIACDLQKFAVKDVYGSWLEGRAKGSAAAFNVLALSAGGEFGAYGAGFLLGWKKAGPDAKPAPRADIQVVTGVSTGAILATHAFLNRDEDADTSYRNLSGADIFRARSPIEYLWANSLWDTTKRDKAIEDFLTTEIIGLVAAEAGSGRSLYIGVVNLDSGEFVRLDMTRLAKETPMAIRDTCYRAVIAASSAIPIAYSPKFIDASMWVDGGTRRHLFITQPPPEAMGGTPRRLYSIVHGDLSAGEEKVKNGVLQIAERTSALLNDESLKDSIRLQEDFASKCPAAMQCGPGGRLFESRYASGARAATECAPKLEQCPKQDASGGDTYCKAYLGCLADRGYEDGTAYAKGTPDWLSAKDLCLGTDPDCGQNINARRRPYQ